jgi:hypothetical protein
MYIVHEILGFSHPLKQNTNIQWLDQYAYSKFEVAYIAPENVSSVDLSGILYRELEEAEAKSAKWVKADHTGKLGMRPGSEIHEELFELTTDTHPTKPKTYYYLTEEDLAEALDFYQHLMLLDLDIHYSKLSAEEVASNTSLKQQIIDEINACQDLVAARQLMHQRFGTATSLTLATENNWGNPTLNLSV